LLDDFGGEEVFGEQNKAIESLLGAKASDIVFVTSDDDMEATDKISNLIGEDKEIKTLENCSLYDLKGMKVVRNYADGGLLAFFVKKSDKAKLEAIVKATDKSEGFKPMTDADYMAYAGAPDDGMIVEEGELAFIYSPDEKKLYLLDENGSQINVEDVASEEAVQTAEGIKKDGALTMQQAKAWLNKKGKAYNVDND